MMLRKRMFFFTVVLWIAFGVCGFAQEATLEDAIMTHNIDMVQNLMLARSSPDYRVTPGDVYTLTYSLTTVGGINTVSYTIVVDADSRIRVSNLGIVNGAGRTFPQVRAEVEALVIRHHPLSGPQLVLTRPAIFRVFVQGEVLRAGEHAAWGLTRLCSFLDENLSRFASIRDVSVTSTDGQTRIYDLFRFKRLGDQTQNPFLRPGDVVSFNRASRIVTITGAVERAGIYQLLDGENIIELIEFYGHGFTTRADPSRVEVVRHTNREAFSGDRLFLTQNDIQNNFVLEHYDTVHVLFVTQVMPVVFVEGAVNIRDAVNIATGAGIPTIVAANRLSVRFYTGDTYAALVRRNAAWFSSVSDTRNAYVIRRDGEFIPMNLNYALSDSSYRGEVLIQDGDVLVVPFRQFFVTVAGAVANPGRFPFSPGRGVEHYIGLAGGFVPGRNISGGVRLTDKNGRRMRSTDPITPETVITARTNHPMFIFNQYATPILTTVSILLGVIALTAATR